MKISQSNYLNMLNAVLAHFDSNVPVWSGIRIIAESVGRLRNTLADITGTATRQRNGAGQQRGRYLLNYTKNLHHSRPFIITTIFRVFQTNAVFITVIAAPKRII